MDQSMVFATKFSEDLMKTIYVNEGIFWQPNHGLDRVLPKYSKEIPSSGVFTIATCIEAIIEYNVEDIADCHREIVEDRQDTREQFCFQAIRAAPVFFQDGYDHQAMLCYCAIVAGVCRMCFRRYGMNDVLDAAAEAIAMILNAFMITGEFDLAVFDGLVEVAKKIVKALGKKVKEVFQCNIDDG